MEYFFKSVLLFVIGSVMCYTAAARREITGVEKKEVKISTIEALIVASGNSNQNVTMAPGVYVVTKTLPNDPNTVFNFSGSNNRFGLHGVTIQIDTRVMANMGPAKVHDLAAYRIEGNDLEFEGALFEDIGDQVPKLSLPEFQIRGDNAVFRNCRFVIRGSAPYGYGDMYGKGSGSAVKLHKHSAIAIAGDRALIDSCNFRIHTFGHGISIHGAQNTVIRNVFMEGDLRLTDEIYSETNGLAAKFDNKIKYPPWHEGKPIPVGEMLSLTEDGIRAYTDGADRNGNTRRTGHITVENCFVKRMRGGITITMATGGTVTGCTVIDCDHAYSIPPNGLVRNCKGNAAYGPLLEMPYSNQSSADIELELLYSKIEMGNHALAQITGNQHKITFTYSGKQIPVKLRPILVGDVGYRYTTNNSTEKELVKVHSAKSISIVNQTPYPVILTKYSSNCIVNSQGKILDDNGLQNVIRNFKTNK
jgi:hypothetical protein